MPDVEGQETEKHPEQNNDGVVGEFVATLVVGQGIGRLKPLFDVLLSGKFWTFV